MRNRPGSVFSSRARRSSAASLCLAWHHSRKLLTGGPRSRFKDGLLRWHRCNLHDEYHETDVRLSESEISTSTPSLTFGTPPKKIVASAEILTLTLRINISASLTKPILIWVLSEKATSAVSFWRENWRRDALCSCKRLWRISRRGSPLSPIVFLTTTWKLGRWFGAARRPKQIVTKIELFVTSSPLCTSVYILSMIWHQRLETLQLIFWSAPDSASAIHEVLWNPCDD